MQESRGLTLVVAVVDCKQALTFYIEDSVFKEATLVVPTTQKCGPVVSSFDRRQLHKRKVSRVQHQSIR